jgi:hypothetical protein
MRLNDDEYQLTEDLVSHIVLPDEVAQELFIDPVLINNLHTVVLATA